MGRTILAAVIAAILTSMATTLVLSSLADDRARTMEGQVSAAEKRASDAEERVKTALDRIDRLGDRIQRTESAVNEAQRNAIAAVQASGAPTAGGAEALQSPDGTPYVSRAELEKLLAEHPVAAAGDGVGTQGWTPPEAKTLEEISADMGLTAQQESTLRVILRDAEQEMVNMLFGQRPIEDVKAEIRRAKDDPDAQAELIQGVIMRGVGNAGKVITWENRVRKKVEDALGADTARDFLSRPRKPVLDPDFEKVFDEAFGH